LTHPGRLAGKTTMLLATLLCLAFGLLLVWDIAADDKQ
jgi:hypothetical protein